LVDFAYLHFAHVGTISVTKNWDRDLFNKILIYH
jgi:hypothetical protein